MVQAAPRRILVLAPMTVELAPAAKALGLRATDGGERRGVLGEVAITAVLAGVGPRASVATARSQIEEFEPDHVVVVGVAGGVADDIAVGDLIVPAVAVDLDGGGEYEATPLGDVEPEGRLMTSGTLILDPAILRAHADAGVDAVDMETAPVAGACHELGLPWTAFRGISDHYAEGLLDSSTVGLLHPDGSPNLAAVARYVARRPANVARLARLGRGTRSATDIASKALRAAIEAEDSRIR